MRRLRLVPLRVAVPVLLMVVLAVLAALQYRWLGQVSRSERQRMHETMSRRAEALAADIDREVSRVYTAFQLRDAQAGKIDEALAARYKLWRETSRHPDLVSDIYLVPADGTLQRFDTAAGTLAPIPWPANLKAIQERGRVTRVAPTSSGTGPGPITFRLPQTISTEPLAVSVLLPFITRVEHDGVIQTRMVSAPASLLMVLNQQKFVGEILPQLVTQHLGDSLDEYRLSIVKSRAVKETVYTSAPDRPVIAPEEADVQVIALGPRVMAVAMGNIERVAAERSAATSTTLRPAPAPPPAAPAPGSGAGGRSGGGRSAVTVTGDRVTLFVDQRQPAATSPLNMAVPRAGGSGSAFTTGAWQVLLKHRAGSLDAAVQRLRRRNLVMSFGMLALLAASVGLVLVSARRAERLASQQMDFVATVSHELRTPLAVIRSAGQNLAAGVVQDTRRYGDLIETEGRRLTDMIEQTLALAGFSGERKPMAQQPIDAGDIVRAVLAAPETASRAAGVQIDLRVAEELPLVLGDEMLLRRGVQNLVANALKYGASGRWVGIVVDAAGSRRGREVRITVSDRGPGVTSEDLPHIFDAFYRGRKAVADQVQGNGLGLHLVKRIAEAHGGRVTVRTAPGEGSSFTIHIPSRADLAVHTLASEPQTS